jgi:hypothetical protein
MDHENTTAGTTAQGSWREEVFITGLERCKVNRNAEEPIAIRRAVSNCSGGQVLIFYGKQVLISK